MGFFSMNGFTTGIQDNKNLFVSVSVSSKVQVGQRVRGKSLLFVNFCSFEVIEMTALFSVLFSCKY